MQLEDPATHLSLVLIACRRYETKLDFAGTAVVEYRPMQLVIDEHEP
jgi:hypothetical protein